MERPTREHAPSPYRRALASAALVAAMAVGAIAFVSRDSSDSPCPPIEAYKQETIPDDETLDAAIGRYAKYTVQTTAELMDQFNIEPTCQGNRLSYEARYGRFDEEDPEETETRALLVDIEVRDMAAEVDESNIVLVRVSHSSIRNGLNSPVVYLFEKEDGVWSLSANGASYQGAESFNGSNEHSGDRERVGEVVDDLGRILGTAAWEPIN
jgi:hypothetical protein